MVVATVTVVAGVAAIVATGGTAAPIVAAAAEGVVLGATGAATATASGVAVATAAATSAGAVTGAVAVGAAGTAAATATGVVTGAATSAAIAGGTALGVSASGTGAAGLVTAGVAAGPVGWLVLGTEKHIIHKMYTFDCWKPVVHEMSTEPSKGKLLRDVVGDPRVKQTIVKSNEDGQLPEIILQNIWDELFRIDFVMLSSQQLAAHARLRVNASVIRSVRFDDISMFQRGTRTHDPRPIVTEGLSNGLLRHILWAVERGTVGIPE